MSKKEQINIFEIKISLFFLLVVTYLFLANGLPWIEADYQLQKARNVVTRHALSTEQKAFLNDVKGINNRWYDCHGLTNVLMMVPIAYSEKFIYKHTGKDTKHVSSFLGALTGVIINALVCLIFFSILSIFKRPLIVCFYTTLCLAFLTIVLPYATTNYEGNLNMLFISGSLWFLFSFLKNNKIIYLALSGCFTGLAVATRDFSLIFLFCMCIFVFYLWVKEKKLKIPLIFLAASLPFLILWGYYNLVRTGHFYLSPIATGIIDERWSAPNQNVLSGLKGLLFSSGGNIFAYSPVLLIALFGWKKYFLAQKKECTLSISVVVLFLLANAKFPNWFGFPGPRYTLEITPLMMLPLAYLLPVDDWRNKMEKYFFNILCGYSLLIQLSAVLVNRHGRLEFLLKKGAYPALFTARYSQWWDSLKTLFINMWNMFFGIFAYIKNPGYSAGLSPETIYTSQTLFTWWNRLFFMGISPVWIFLYILLTLTTIFYTYRYIITSIKSEMQ